MPLSSTAAHRILNRWNWKFTHKRHECTVLGTANYHATNLGLPGLLVCS
jgi:hypothetical protein